MKRFVPFIIAAVAAAILLFRTPLGCETDLWGLLGGDNAGILQSLAARQGGVCRVIFSGTDEDSAVDTASSFLFKSTNATDSVSSVLDCVKPFAACYMPDDVRALLKRGETRAVADRVIASLYSPSSISLFTRKADPYGFATQTFASALDASSFGGWSMRNGMLVRRDGTEWVTVREFPQELAADVWKAFVNFKSDDVKALPSGAPLHTVLARDASVRELNVLGFASMAFVLAIGFWLMGSFRCFAGILRVLIVAFLAASAALFAVWPRPHVLTFVFGTSLIGLSVDYAYHAFGDALPRGEFVRKLSLALLSSVSCFAPLLFSSVAVLRQMAIFTMIGLVAAYAVVLCEKRRASDERSANGSGKSCGRRTRHVALKWFCRIAFAALFAGTPFVKFGNDPKSFYNADPNLIEGEKKFAGLNAGASSSFILISGGSLDASLAIEEKIGLKGISSFLPSLERQKENVSLLKKFIASEGEYVKNAVGIKPPSVDGVRLITAGDISGGPLQRLLHSCTLDDGSILFPEAMARKRNVNVGQSENVRILSLQEEVKGVFESLSESSLKLLCIAFAVLLVMLAIAYGRRFPKIFIPLAVSQAAMLGALGFIGADVNFFQILCFFIVAGLGLDYIVFLEGRPDGAQRRIVLASFLTSLVGFGSLAFTSFPVTRSMGITLSLGLLFSYVAAEMFGGGERGDCGAGEEWYEQKEQSAGVWRIMILWYLYRIFGKNVQKVVFAPIMIFIFPFARAARRNLRDFYGRIGISPSPWRLYRHMLGFAWEVMDKMDACSLAKNLPAMRFREDESFVKFKSLVKEGKGAFLISTHVGTIEVLPAARKCAALSDLRSPRFHAFQQMSHNGIFTSVFGKYFDRDSFELHPVETIGVETAVEMKDAIGRGEFVLMAGDRVSAGSSKATLDATVLGGECRLPKGVFVFAKLMESPVFFITCVRIGWNAYEVHLKSFEGAPSQMAVEYARFLDGEARRYPLEWFHFHRFWKILD